MDRHETAGDDERAQVRKDHVELLERLVEAHLAVQREGLVDAGLDQGDFVLDLVFSGVGIDATEHGGALVLLLVEDELTGRLGAPEEEDGKDDGGNAAESDHPAPTGGNVVKCGVDGVGYDLAEGDGNGVDGHHSSTEACWR